MGSTYVQMSRCRLEQVIINLLTNAAEALADSTGKATIRAEEDNGEVIITVADEGRGIQQAEIPRVFDAYFSTKDNHLGLGLLVVRQIARDYGGYAAIESRPGQGTQVRCVLPAAEGPSSGSIPAGWDLPPRPPRSRSGQRRKVSDQGQGGR
jgi:two-component system C4-dicarboxylate transport sensor histidine kinase DctB